MRKVINIVGVGNRMSGTGKNSGKPYDFTPVAFTYDDPFVHGVKCATVNVNQDAFGPDYVPSVGDCVEVVMREDFRTGRVYVEAFL